MEKQLQNYLHFYIGQQAEGFWNNDDGSKESEGIGSILKVSAENIRSYGPAPVVLLLPVRKHSDNKIERHFYFEDVKPLLRPLSDMTDEEGLTLAKIYSGAEIVKPTPGGVSNFRYYLCSFRVGEHGGTDERMIIGTSGEAWYEHYFDGYSKGKRGRNIINSHEATRYLIQCGFDLFDLIPAGLALDKTKQLSESREGGE